MKYSIQQFREEYSNEEVCLDKVFKLRYDNLSECPHCNETVTFRRVSTRRCYQCPKCYHQLFPCAGTIFEKSRTPLMYWFYAMFLFSASKNGLSASELERQLGVTYKTAFRMLRQIRILLSNKDIFAFDEITETDETYIGGKQKNKHKDKRVANTQGRSAIDKTPVFGMLKRGGKVKAFVVPDTSSFSLKPIIYKYVKQGSTIFTDEWKAYKGLSKFYNHSFVEHGKKNYAKEGGVTTNGIENFWSILKRTLHGSYVSVSPKYLQLYVNEVCFRFNSRFADKPTFDVLLNYLSVV